MTAAALHAVPARPRALAFERGQTVVALYDALREQRIQALKRLLDAAIADRHRDEAYRLHAEFRAALDARSPEQVERMEHARFKHPPGSQSA